MEAPTVVAASTGLALQLKGQIMTTQQDYEYVHDEDQIEEMAARTWCAEFRDDLVGSVDMRILHATVVVGEDPEDNALQIHEIEGPEKTPGPRECSRVFRALAAKATKDSTDASKELESAGPHRAEKLRYRKALADHAAAVLFSQAFREEDKAARRPLKGLMAFMTRGLGHMPDVEVPEVNEFKRPFGYRFLAVLLFLAVIVGMSTLFTLVPGALYSPVDTAAGEVATDYMRVSIHALILGVVVIALLRGGWSSIDRFMFRAAMTEEVAFRLGSENWTWKQRLRSCVGFGLAHALNIVLVAVSCGMLMVVGAVFMVVYRRQVKKTSDPKRALYVAARFHADYNMAIIGVMLATGGLFVLSQIVLALTA